MLHETQPDRHAIDASPLVLNLKGVAAALGVSPQRFRNIRRELEKLGFPRALPVLTGRWSRAAVVAWVEHNGQPAQVVTKSQADEEVAFATQEFQRRYVGGAA